MLFFASHQHLHILLQFLRTRIEVFSFGKPREVSTILPRNAHSSFLSHSFKHVLHKPKTKLYSTSSSSSSSFVSFVIVFAQVYFLSTSNIRTKIGVKAMGTIDVIYRVNSITKSPKKFSSSHPMQSSGHLRSTRDMKGRKLTAVNYFFSSWISLVVFNSMLFNCLKKSENGYLISFQV